jgi:mono/diheme cytochrome c family protein
VIARALRAVTVGVVAGAALAVVPAWAEPDGAAVFQKRCAPCHGASGRTDTPAARALKVRPLADDPVLARMTPSELVHAITSNPKHRGVSALADAAPADIEAAARFVHELAAGH